MLKVESNRLQILQNAFPQLNQEEIIAFDRVARERHYPAGNVICREGDSGAVFYILAQGEAEIISLVDSQEILLRRVRPADFFGEMALIGLDDRRTATVRTIGPCQVLEIDKPAFLELADRYPAVLQALVREMVNHLRLTDRNIISQLMAQNHALEVAHEKLAEQERIRSEFIAILSHEFRTPLTSMQGFLHLLNKGVISGNSVQVGLDVISRNVERMVWLVNNLLVLYEMHLIAPRLNQMTLAELITEALAEVKLLHSNQISQIRLEIDSELPFIAADRPALTFALRSIIDNALKFSPEGQEVVIRASRFAENQVKISIVDRGVGIPSEARQRIFEPFYRTTSPGESHVFPGLGIGLSIARYIIDLHGGRIEVESEPGRGSSFHVILPGKSSYPL